MPVISYNQNLPSLIEDREDERRTVTPGSVKSVIVSGVKRTKHTHKFTIGDDDAVQVLLEKLLDGGSRQRRREKLLKALKQAARSYSSSKQKEHQAFFHGLLTGYAVALKLW